MSVIRIEVLNLVVLISKGVLYFTYLLIYLIFLKDIHRTIL